MDYMVDNLVLNNNFIVFLLIYLSFIIFNILFVICLYIIFYLSLFYHIILIYELNLLKYSLK